jgi:hypothetical protein
MSDIVRHWVNNEKGRKERMETLLACKTCDFEFLGGVVQETRPPFSQSPE